jgi:UDP-N-acetylglucosamine 2-epimerase (non-hydrolysing)
MNRPLRVITIFGTRPEAVKMSPIIKFLADSPDQVETCVCVTAQHRQMLDQVLNLFQITPDIDLDLMRTDQSLAELTARIFNELDPVLKSIKPDWMLIQGDTTTVMAAAILGYYNKIKIGHVEAGLRTYNKWQPFPEELNRKIAGVTTDLHFAPTEHNRQNLLSEGVPDENIKVTGNPVIDALQNISQFPTPPETINLLEKTGVSTASRRLILVTAHRRENFGQPIIDICTAIKRLAAIYTDQAAFIYPVHLNPNIYQPVHKALTGFHNIFLIEPLDYLPMIHLLKHAALILTDSGGIQEEASALGIPTLVLREYTERQEGVEAGTLKLVGTTPDRIVAEAQNLLDDPAAHAAMAGAVNPYGDGNAAERIVQAIMDYQNIH